jgi:AcrR family transcriptional regulator
MPTPERTNLPRIVEAAQAVLEESGPDGLTMAAVAARVGVRAPSLYKRVGGRAELLGLVADATVADLGERIAAAMGEAHDGGNTPRAALARMVRAYRRFATERPGAYELVFSQASAEARARPESLTRAVAPALAATERLVGPDHALDAARLLTAWVHGFVSMELSGSFRLAGGVDRAFEYGVAALVDTLGA